MYIDSSGGVYYNSAGEQCARRARFLLLVQLEAGGEIRGIVRKVALRQLGHWMMGRARVRGESLTISGSYGHDGLPMTVGENVFAAGVKLPDDLREAWSKGGGWNGAGSEAPAMRAWARQIMGQ